MYGWQAMPAISVKEWCMLTIDAESQKFFLGRAENNQALRVYFGGFG
jgi:hypothetical protein